MNWPRWFRGSPWRVAACSDAGSVRTENQDSYYASSAKACFCVADGMGGGQGGSAASSIAVEEVVKAAADRSRAAGVRFGEAIAAANTRIREHAKARGYSVMATTLALLAAEDGDRALVANVGDSRVYRRRQRRLEQLTVDHRMGAFSNFLTRAVGSEENVEPTFREIDLAKGDMFLVCSDGVSDMLGDSTINAIMAYGGGVEAVVERMAEAVRRAGARDNFSIVVAEYR